MTLDFHTNKKISEEVAIIPSNRLRNKIAGFSTTHLMKRIQKGPVRGISLKLQEEERERRMDFVPEESAIKIDEIKVEAFEAGESSEEQDGRNNVSHQVEKLMQEKKKKEEEMEENEGSDLDLDLSLSQPGLFCKDKSSSSTSQNSCISADNSLLFEASTLIVMGCINCHLYVMVSRQHSRCPKCNSSLLLDIFQPYSACN